MTGKVKTKIVRSFFIRSYILINDRRQIKKRPTLLAQSVTYPFHSARIILSERQEEEL